MRLSPVPRGSAPVLDLARGNANGRRAGWGRGERLECLFAMSCLDTKLPIEVVPGISVRNEVRYGDFRPIWVLLHDPPAGCTASILLINLENQ